jgi:hypothetical protein
VEKLLPKLENLEELDRETVYFDGINKIEKEMKSILKDHPKSRVVVFIDDLDRCSPKKVLEVFESIKVFLGIEGFIYVIGLSHETVSKLISAEYKASEIKGENYIKKIIQIPINIPQWNTSDVNQLITKLSTKVSEKYKSIIQDPKQLEIISRAVEYNPREVKRFINNFIVANELYSNNPEIDTRELLVCQALNVRWNRFYNVLANSDKEFREILGSFVDNSEDQRSVYLEATEKESPKHYQIIKVLKEFKDDTELWNFLQNNKSTIEGIKNWEAYRRAAKAVKEITESPKAEENPLRIRIYLSQDNAASNQFSGETICSNLLGLRLGYELLDRSSNTNQASSKALYQTISSCAAFPVIIQEGLSSAIIEEMLAAKRIGIPIDILVYKLAASSVMKEIRSWKGGTRVAIYDDESELNGMLENYFRTIRHRLEIIRAENISKGEPY